MNLQASYGTHHSAGGLNLSRLSLSEEATARKEMLDLRTRQGLAPFTRHLAKPCNQNLSPRGV